DQGRSFNDMHPPLPQSAFTEPWTATVRCAGTEAWLMIQGGGAAGHIAYAAFRTTNEGTRILPVLQEALTHPLGQPIDIYASPDPYPGPFTVFDRTHAYFLNWCPVCGDTPTASITEVA